MTYYEKVIIPDSAWKGLLKQIPEQDIKRIFGSTKILQKGNFQDLKSQDGILQSQKNIMKRTQL